MKHPTPQASPQVPIFTVRGRRIVLDSDLARLYGVTTKRLNEQVRRNIERFPADFMFQLTTAERDALMLQIATSKPTRGGRRKLPFAFTEHGAIMTATLLSSSRAVEMSIYVVRAFVHLRAALAAETELARRVTKLERGHETHGSAITGILKTLNRMQDVPQTRAIGFVELTDKKDK